MKRLLFILLMLQIFSSSANNVCDIKEENRFDCFPEANANEHDCLARGCCWKPASSSDLAVPYCFYGNGNFGYEVFHSQNTTSGFIIDLHLLGPGGHYGGNIKKLKAEFQFESWTRLHVKIYDAETKRYEVPIPSPEVKGKFGSEYSLTYSNFPFGFTVKRRQTGKVIFHSGVGGFIFSDQFIQFSSLLPSHNIFGLGEHVLPFKLSTNWLKLTSFSRDVATPTGGFNLYGTHPFYLNIENDGKANGVFLKNSNAMDIILQPTPAITYRTIGGILDFYIFTGPTPSQVVAEYNEVIGKPTMPPYWSLGFHLCKYGYGSIEKMAKVRRRMADNKIPQDTQWNDIDYMLGRKDFTIDRRLYHGLSQFVDWLHGDGIHYIIIVDPAISNTEGYKPFDDGVRDNTFIKDSNGDILVGKVWPGTTVFPDFFHPNASMYWYNQIKSFHKELKFDGLWIDMNEPSNFVQGSTKGCKKNKLNNPPYLPNVIGNYLPDKTLCMDAQQHGGKHYDLHSLYGHSEAVATMSALRKLLGKRSLVVTRSSFSGTGHHAAHWLGDNRSTWKDLYYSISGMLNFNMFGIPMVGADICGFLDDTTEELCSRWMQLGAFYPFSRNHNNLHQRDQDPAAFGKQLITASKEALKVRYTLLPYLYTLLFESHTNGATVARPLFFEFMFDNSTYGIDSQFMWGAALLISPVLYQGATSVNAYFPKGTWYEYYTGGSVVSSGQNISLPAAFDKVNVHIRGGWILPIQDPALTTTASRKNDFGLIVALDKKGNSGGSVYLDDGESFIAKNSWSFVKFVCFQNKLSSVVVKKSYVPKYHKLAHIKVLGVSVKPTKVLVNGKVIQPTYDASHKVLTMVSLNLSMIEEFSIVWGR